MASSTASSMATRVATLLLLFSMLILAVNAVTYKTCKHKKFYQCYLTRLPCPAACPKNCDFDCEECKTVCKCLKGGSICQDPQFVGGDGITFYFHGKKDRNFCLVSDSDVHINGHFIGKRVEGMSRDFTWVQSLGVLFNNNQLYFGAKKVAKWSDDVDQFEIIFNGETVVLPTNDGAQWTTEAAPGLTITRISDTNEIAFEVAGIFKITSAVVPITEEESRIHRYGITDEDCFAHLDLGFKFYSLSENVNGVLGQTYAQNYQSRVKVGVPMPVLGGNREFLSSGLFTSDCAVSKFGARKSGSQVKADDLGMLDCGSGLTGRGIVCKK